jgi:hypothetical protein
VDVGHGFVCLSLPRQWAKGATLGSPTIRLIWTTIMNDSEYLALQASIICVLFFVLGNAAIIEHPEWFR